MTTCITPALAPSNDKNIDVSYGYGDTKMASNKKRSTQTSVCGLRVSSLQETLYKSVPTMNTDEKGDREFTEEEIVQAANSLVSTTKVNIILKIVIVVYVCLSAMLLTRHVFSATIAIARLTEQTEIDSLTGIMYLMETNSDHSHQTTMKTEDVVIYSDITSTGIMDMTNEELKTLKEILLSNGDVKFQVEGYARGKDNTEIRLLVEGGTIIYDNEGLASATGNAKILLDLAYGVQEAPQDKEEDGVGIRRRYLATRYSGSQAGQGSGASNGNRISSF